MRENRIRTIWAGGGVAINGWLSAPSSVTAEVMARQGWDSLTIDLQHGLIDYADAVPMLQAISQTDTVPLVRVPWNEPVFVQRLLDAGAYGVICPMVNGRADAKRFVAACRYHPEGIRSVGPTRALLYAGADYVREANRTVLTLAMIETAEALANIDAILATPGLDAVFVGPSDLSVQLGFAAGNDPEFPPVLDAIAGIAERARKHEIPAGIYTGSVAYALRMRDLGYRLITLLSDLRLIQWAGGRALAALRAGEARPDAP